MADLTGIADEIDELPTADDVCERGAFSLRIYEDRFGSFSGARERALGED